MKLTTTVALIALAATTGCFRHSYSTGVGGNTNGEARYSEWHHHFLFGLIGEKHVDVRSICPSGNATIKDEISFVNGIIGGLLGQLYYPSTVEVYCDGKVATMTLSPETLQAIGRDPALVPAVELVSHEKAQELKQAVLRDEARERLARGSSGSKLF